VRIVAFIASRDACGYYRIFQPLSELAAHGHHVEFCSVFPAETPDCDIFVIGRVGDSEGNLPWDSWKGPLPKIVFDLEDNLFELPEHHPAPWIQWPKYLSSIERALREADLVTVTNSSLASIAVRHGAYTVQVLPNHIDESLLQFPRREVGKSSLPVAGFSGGIGHSQDVATIASPLSELLADYVIDLHFMGADHRNLPGLGSARYTPWTDDIGKYYETYDFDIALAPLAPTTFNESKSGIRALEAMALGIPVVASASLPYVGLVHYGVNGFLAKSTDQWIDYVSTISENPRYRDQLGDRGRALASEWTIQKGYVFWEGAYGRLL
jgi:glycosyltransferase involved in cell wall biosynthesis